MAGVGRRAVRFARWPPGVLGVTVKAVWMWMWMIRKDTFRNRDLFFVVDGIGCETVVLLLRLHSSAVNRKLGRDAAISKGIGGATKRETLGWKDIVVCFEVPV